MDRSQFIPLADNAWRIEPFGQMRVPAILYASTALIDAMRAVMADPDRPAMRMLTINGENSRVTERAIPITTFDSAPKVFRVAMDWIASMTPTAKHNTEMMGIAAMPISMISLNVVAVRTGCLRHLPITSQYRLATKRLKI